MFIFKCCKKKKVNPKHTPKELPIEVDPKWIDLACSITGDFEGAGPAQVTGNFDRQGVSLGFLQWNFGQGSAQSKLLRPYADEFGTVKLDSFFPSPISPLLSLSNSEAVKYIRKTFHTGYSSTKLKEEWKMAFQVFLLQDEVLVLQRKASESIATKAMKYCLEFNMVTKKSFCFFFDIVVQNGSLKGHIPFDTDRITLSKNLEEYSQEHWHFIKVDDESTKLANLIFERANRNKWRKDVLSRKLTIAFAKGTVHGKFYTLSEVFK